jgi:predicted RNA-binding protein
MGQFAEKLKAFQEMWTSTKGGNVSVPNGQYILQLIAAELGESQQGNLRILRKFTILEGEYAGDTVVDFLVLSNKWGCANVRTMFQLCGYEAPENIADLEGSLDELVGLEPAFQAAVSTGEAGISNARLRKLVSMQGHAPDESGKESPSDDIQTVETTRVSPSIEKPGKTKKEEEVEEEVNEEAKGSSLTEEDEDQDEIEEEEAPSSASKDESLVPEDSIEVGDTVKFLDQDKKEITGKVKKIQLDGTIVVLRGQTHYALGRSRVTKLQPEGAKALGEDATQDEPLRTKLLAFAQSADLKVSDEMSTKELIKMISSFTYKREELTDEEVDLLRQIDAEIVGGRKISPQARHQS